jgi:uncharacterized repeat protein (TIGR01451 family)
MMMRLLAAWLLAALALPVAAQAAGVALKSAVFVEKTEVAADGRARVVLHEPAMVTPGDRLVFVLSYRNDGGKPAGNFIVTNPVPPAVAYQGVADRSARVSVDGGRNWGDLAMLTVRDPDGALRPARSDDVTHVRWTFAKAIAPGTAGKLSFRGVVR